MTNGKLPVLSLNQKEKRDKVSMLRKHSTTVLKTVVVQEQLKVMTWLLERDEKGTVCAGLTAFFRCMEQRKNTANVLRG